MTTPNIAQSVTDALSRLIESAPAGDDATEAVQTPSRPSYVTEKGGWGRRYRTEIPLCGEKWLEALKTATDAVEACGIVALIGGRGNGKTQMAAEIARGGRWPHDPVEFVPGYGGPSKTVRPKNARYIRAMDIFLEVREAQKNTSPKSEKMVLESLASVGLLVIDEFQERGETPFENRIMKNLIDKRYADERPTIIIANGKREEVGESLGSSIKDRVRDGGCVIEFTWPSYRGAKP